MSTNKKKWTIVGFVGGGVVLIALGVLVFFFSSAGVQIHDVAATSSAKREHALSMYNAVGVPAGLEMRNQTQTGDPIDSPEQTGLDSNYRVQGDADQAQKVYESYISNLQKAGFTIQESTHPTTDEQKRAVYNPTNDSTIYEVKAVNQQNKVTFYLTMYNDRKVNTTIIAAE